MKIVVMNLSGNTGKTTLARHMIAPMLNAKRISIEDINAGDGVPDAEITATRFKTLAAELNYVGDDENIVIDVGASNAKVMLNNFDQLSSTTEGIDFWLIPVTPSTKQRTDSLNTVTKLLEIGIDNDKIILVPNNVTEIETFEDDFKNVFDACGAIDVFVSNQPVLANEAYEMLKTDERCILDIANSKPDFASQRKALHDAGDEDGLLQLGKDMVLYDLCKYTAKNLQRVFKSLPLAKQEA